MRRTKEEAEVTRQGILDAALVLFSAQGIAATSLAEVASRAGVTRGAIYWHFKNKWDLFDAIWQQHSAPLETLGQASQAEQEPDPLGKLRQLLILILQRVEQNEAFRRMFTICIRETRLLLDGELPERMRALQDELHQRRVSTLRNAMRRGQLPPDLDPELGSLMVRVMLEGFVQTWLQHRQCFSLSARSEQLVESIIAVLQHGVRQR